MTVLAVTTVTDELEHHMQQPQVHNTVHSSRMRLIMKFTRTRRHVVTKAELTQATNLKSQATVTTAIVE